MLETIKRIPSLLHAYVYGRWCGTSGREFPWTYARWHRNRLSTEKSKLDYEVIHG